MKTIARSLVVALLGVLVLPVASAVAQSAEPGWISLETARDYRKAARYPDWSRALEAGAEDPVRAKRTSSKITVRGAEGEGPALSVWSKQVSYEHPAPVLFFASLEGKAPAVVTGEVVNPAGLVVGTLKFFDDGVAPDKLAGDGLLTARFVFAKSYRPEMADNFLVRIQATLGNGEPRFATAGFLYSRPHAKLTGRYRERLDDGNLVISAQVKVTEAGRFHLAGTLETLADEAIGTAQAAAELEPGRHWVDLSFYGLMFHDRAVAGPFRLGSAALSTTGGMPNAMNDLVEDAYVTRSLPTKSFTARPFGHRGLLESAKRLELDAKRAGARLDE